MMENMEIAKRKKSEWELRLIERQQKLKNLADRRIASLKLADSTKEKQHNDLLRTIYLHDDKYVSSLQCAVMRQTACSVFQGD